MGNFAHVNKLGPPDCSVGQGDVAIRISFQGSVVTLHSLRGNTMEEDLSQMMSWASLDLKISIQIHVHNSHNLDQFGRNWKSFLVPSGPKKNPRETITG